MGHDSQVGHRIFHLGRQMSTSPFSFCSRFISAVPLSTTSVSNSMYFLIFTAADSKCYYFEDEIKPTGCHCVYMHL